MHNKKALCFSGFFLFAFFLLSLSASAAFDVYITPVNTSIFANQYAVFELQIHNAEDYKDVFQVYLADPNWILVEPNSVSAQADETITVNVVIKPKSDVFLGPHGVTMVVKSSRTGTFKKSTEVISVVPFEHGIFGYPPNVALAMNMPDQIDPRAKARVDLILRNRNNQDIKNLTIRIYSDLFEKEYLTDIDALQEKANTLLFELNHIEVPGTHKIQAWALVSGVVISEATQNFEIIGYSDVVQEVKEEKLFFQKSYEITFRNNGNQKTVQEYRMPTNFIKKLFTSTDPKAESLNVRAKSYLVWNIELSSGQQATIKVRENYILLFIILALLIVVCVLYFVLRPPIVLTKQAKVLKQSEEEQSASEIKVLIHARNRTGKRVGGIKVSDRITPISVFIDEKHLGTLKPTKVISHSNKGTLLKWEIDHLEPYEERVISYKIRTKLGIVGGMKLRPARVRFESSSGGRERRVKSNSVDLVI